MAVLRTSLIPGLLRTMVEQEATPMDRVFEVGPVYLPRSGDTPDEHYMVAVAHRAAEGGEGLWRQVKGGLDVAVCAFGNAYALERGVVPAWAHPGRCAQVMLAGESVGVIAEVHPDMLAAFGLKQIVGVVLLDVPGWMKVERAPATYREPAAFPAAERDVAVLVDEALAWASVARAVHSGSPLVESVELFDVYRGKGIPVGKKSFAMHLALRASDRTLTGEDADRAVEGIVAALTALGATVRE
jgi:phenylalanyl-tRNA synthetase beta chain